MHFDATIVEAYLASLPADRRETIGTVRTCGYYPGRRLKV